MHKPVGYYHYPSLWGEAYNMRTELTKSPNPYPLGQFAKAVSDYLENLIWFHVEDTGNLPTAQEYLKMCQSALENAVR